MENYNEQSVKQVDRFLRKVLQKFPSVEDPVLLTDIHLLASPESGDLMAFDDDDVEISRCVVEEWIDNKSEQFYPDAALLLRSRLNTMVNEIENVGLLKPFSFVLENEDKEHVAELYVCDDDINIIGGDIMEGWDKDLDSFLDKLMGKFKKRNSANVFI